MWFGVYSSLAFSIKLFLTWMQELLAGLLCISHTHVSNLFYLIIFLLETVKSGQLYKISLVLYGGVKGWKLNESNV